uniref:FtsJ domain-containing protein n=1 Tax=Panagrellus redivivus TaxID=6233 RepID=A0A7E4UNJ2_PANRE
MGKTKSDKRDIYYRKAKELGFRARSAFKLMECDATYNLFEGVETAVDLCAAPGSWSQVLSKLMKPHRDADEAEFLKAQEGGFLLPNGSVETASGEIIWRRNRVVSIDIQPMSAIPGVHIIQGDLTRQETIEAIIDALGGQQAGIVVCDGAPDVTGFHGYDEMMQSQLIYPAFMTAMSVLKPGGHFVSKIFRAQWVNFTVITFMQFFEEVYCYKPSSSRPDSTEHFLVCKNYRPIPGLEPVLQNPRLAVNYKETIASFTPVQRKYICLLANNDLDGWDAETLKKYGLERFIPQSPRKHHALNTKIDKDIHELVNEGYGQISYEELAKKLQGTTLKTIED